MSLWELFPTLAPSTEAPLREAPRLTLLESASLWAWPGWVLETFRWAKTEDTWVPTQENTPLPPGASAPLTHPNRTEAAPPPAGWAAAACGRAPLRTEIPRLPGLTFRALEGSSQASRGPTTTQGFRTRHCQRRARGLCLPAPPPHLRPLESPYLGQHTCEDQGPYPLSRLARK